MDTRNQIEKMFAKNKKLFYSETSALKLTLVTIDSKNIDMNII